MSESMNYDAFSIYGAPTHVHLHDIAAFLILGVSITTCSSCFLAILHMAYVVRTKIRFYFHEEII